MSLGESEGISLEQRWTVKCKGWVDPGEEAGVGGGQEDTTDGARCCGESGMGAFPGRTPWSGL